MVFKSRKYNKPGFKRYRKTSFRKRRTASKATLVNTVRTVVERSAERKYRVISYNWQAGTQLYFANVPTIHCLTEPPQGLTDSDRVGDRIRLVGVSIRWRTVLDPFVVNPATAQFVNTVQHRVLLVQWFPTSNTIASNDIFDASPYYLSHMRWDNRQMFRVLYDKVYSQTQLNDSSGVSFKKYIDFTKNKRREIQYQSGSSHGTNKVFLVFMSNYGIANGTPSVMEYTARCTYTDS